MRSPVPQNLAEEQEKAGAKEDCISFYSQAAELFAAEDSTSEAAKCRQKVRVPPARNSCSYQCPTQLRQCRSNDVLSWVGLQVV